MELEVVKVAEKTVDKVKDGKTVRERKRITYLQDADGELKVQMLSDASASANAGQLHDVLRLERVKAQKKL
jgi:hypothetical protein